MEKSINKDHLIFWVEQMDAEGASPFWLVSVIQTFGFSRRAAIEIYRIGTLGWSAPVI